MTAFLRAVTKAWAAAVVIERGAEGFHLILHLAIFRAAVRAGTKMRELIAVVDQGAEFLCQSMPTTTTIMASPLSPGL